MTSGAVADATDDRDRPGGGSENRSRPRMQNLQQAAAVVFGLISILPLLAFAYSLYRLNAIGRWEYQISLGVALGVALLGFTIFKMILTRISELLRTMTYVLGNAELSPRAAHRELEVPGIGHIAEIGEMADLVSHLWRAEAEPHVGRSVVVSVMNAPSALRGQLARVTDDGIMLTADGKDVAVAYRRIVAIEAESGSPAQIVAMPNAPPPTL